VILYKKGGVLMIYYTVKEVATMLKMHKQTIHNWIISGKLDSVKIGNTRRISQEQLNKFLEVKSNG